MNATGTAAIPIPVEQWIEHEREVGDLRAQMEVLSARLTTIQWMFGLVLVIAGSVAIRVWM